MVEHNIKEEFAMSAATQSQGFTDTGAWHTPEPIHPDPARAPDTGGRRRKTVERLLLVSTVPPYTYAIRYGAVFRFDRLLMSIERRLERGDMELCDGRLMRDSAYERFSAQVADCIEWEPPLAAVSRGFIPENVRVRPALAGDDAGYVIHGAGYDAIYPYFFGDRETLRQHLAGVSVHSPVLMLRCERCEWSPLVLDTATAAQPQDGMFACTRCGAIHAPGHGTLPRRGMSWIRLRSREPLPTLPDLPGLPVVTDPGQPGHLDAAVSERLSKTYCTGRGDEIRFLTLLAWEARMRQARLWIGRPEKRRELCDLLNRESFDIARRWSTNLALTLDGNAAPIAELRRLYPETAHAGADALADAYNSYREANTDTTAAAQRDERFLAHILAGPSAGADPRALDSALVALWNCAGTPSRQGFGRLDGRLSECLDFASGTAPWGGVARAALRELEREVARDPDYQDHGDPILPN